MIGFMFVHFKIKQKMKTTDLNELHLHGKYRIKNLQLTYLTALACSESTIRKIRASTY